MMEIRRDLSSRYYQAQPSEEHGETRRSDEYPFLCHWFADQSGKIEKYFQDGKEIQNQFPSV